MANQNLMYLRPEAQPVEKWGDLTDDQQRGLLKLLRMLQEAIDRPIRARHQLPWLFAETRTQLAFIDGHRGTGKSTLMTTLVGAVVAPGEFSGGTDGDLIFQTVKRLAQKLHKRVVPVQPLDMESLPEGTPLLAAILARVYRAVEGYCHQHAHRTGLLADDPRGEQRELLKLEQFQHRVAMALDSNLTSRRGNLDAEQFAEAVMKEEENRLQLVSDFEGILAELSKRVQKQLNKLSTHDSSEDRLVFLVPIDDVDLNPDRCLELLRLLRTFAPPRELFFLMMGQYELVESIVKLHMASDFGRLRSNGVELSTVSTESLKNQIAEASVANVRKLVPPQSRIELPPISLMSAVDFRPLES